jgi:hypothetical protein
MADAVEINQDNRIRYPIPFTIFRDPQSIEQLLFGFEQAFQRGNRQGFAKSAGAGQEIKHAAFNHLMDLARFIDVNVAILPDGFEGLDADGKFFIGFPSHVLPPYKFFYTSASQNATCVIMDHALKTGR